MTRQVVLASTSRYRAGLLGHLEVPFEQAAPDFDERALDHRFEELGAQAFALLLARGKAQSLRASYPEALILAADQVAVIPAADDQPDQQLHKPGTPERAVESLMRLRGRTHLLVNGIVLFDAREERIYEAGDVQRMTMRQFSRDEAQAYVDRHAPLDSAGSYRIEDAGIKLFERVESSDYTGIIGLPLLATAGLFRQAGLLP